MLILSAALKSLFVCSLSLNIAGPLDVLQAYKTSNGPAIFRLKEHTNRLFSAADKINIKIPFSKDELNRVQCEILNKNSLDEGYIRPIVYLGNEGLGLRAKDLSVNVAVAAWEWPFPCSNSNINT